jgi:hypothetical protein
MLDEVAVFVCVWVVLHHIVFVKFVDFDYALAVLNRTITYSTTNVAVRPYPRPSRDSTDLERPTPRTTFKNRITDDY